ncbi:hypothetical protein MVUOKPPV_CDS0145 [Klebsiella phage phi1_175008]|uniref:Uncharacterized protein n=1 Tax=Klebsiella phage phi1_175008 TaxID=3127744 RepID=A0ACD5FRA7_9CAUD
METRWKRREGSNTKPNVETSHLKWGYPSLFPHNKIMLDNKY